MWWFMLAMNMLIPVIMFIGGCFMYSSDIERNHVIGYRTSTAMLSDETWRFAQKYCGSVWKKTAPVLAIAIVLVMLPFYGNKNHMGELVGTVLEFVSVLVLILTIIPVEKELKRRFDNYGVPKNPENGKAEDGDGE